MAAYLISYDLRQPRRDYSSLYLRLNAWKALRVLESVFVVSGVQTSAVAIRDDLLGHVDKDDGLFVGALTGEAAWRSLLCSDQSLKDKLKA